MFDVTNSEQRRPGQNRSNIYSLLLTANRVLTCFDQALPLLAASNSELIPWLSLIFFLCSLLLTTNMSKPQVCKKSVYFGNYVETLLIFWLFLYEIMYLVQIFQIYWACRYILNSLNKIANIIFFTYILIIFLLSYFYRLCSCRAKVLGPPLQECLLT